MSILQPSCRSLSPTACATRRPSKRDKKTCVSPPRAGLRALRHKPYDAQVAYEGALDSDNHMTHRCCSADFVHARAVLVVPHGAQDVQYRLCGHAQSQLAGGRVKCVASAAILDPAKHCTRELRTCKMGVSSRTASPASPLHVCFWEEGFESRPETHQRPSKGTRSWNLRR